MLRGKCDWQCLTHASSNVVEYLVWTTELDDHSGTIDVLGPGLETKITVNTHQMLHLAMTSHLRCLSAACDLFENAEYDDGKKSGVMLHFYGVLKSRIRRLQRSQVLIASALPQPWGTGDVCVARKTDCSHATQETLVPCRRRFIIRNCLEFSKSREWKCG